MRGVPRRSSHVLPVVMAAAMVSLASAPVPAQPAAPPSSKGLVVKGKAPVNDSVLEVKLPRAQEVDLPNGLHLIVLEDHRAPLVGFQLLIRGAGGYYDPADLQGLAGFTANVMREGTTQRSSQQISEQLERMAATLTIAAGMSSPDATMSGSAISESFAELMEIAADVLLNPSFPEQELALFKQRTGAQLVQQRSQPSFLAVERFNSVVYGNHPGSRTSPTPDALKAVTRERLAEFHRSHYVPDHAALAVAGDTTLAEVRKLVEKYLGAWRKAGLQQPAVTDPAALTSPRVSLVSRPNSVQTSLVVGTQAISRTSVDYDIVQVMNKVVGGGPTGRLFMHLREEKGYTYGAYSNVSPTRYRGDWVASTDVRSEVTDAALTDLLGEVARMRDEAVTEKDLQIAKRAMVASFALSLENPQQMLTYYTTRWLYNLSEDYWDKYPARVMAVTPAQVQDAGKKYLDPKRLQIVAVGDAAKIRETLAKLGTVEVYDTEGKRISQQPE